MGGDRCWESTNLLLDEVSRAAYGDINTGRLDEVEKIWDHVAVGGKTKAAVIDKSCELAVH